MREKEKMRQICRSAKLCAQSPQFLAFSSLAVGRAPQPPRNLLCGYFSSLGKPAVNGIEGVRSAVATHPDRNRCDRCESR